MDPDIVQYVTDKLTDDTESHEVIQQLEELGISCLDDLLQNSIDDLIGFGIKQESAEALFGVSQATPTSDVDDLKNYLLTIFDEHKCNTIQSLLNLIGISNLEQAMMQLKVTTFVESDEFKSLGLRQYELRKILQQPVDTVQQQLLSQHILNLTKQKQDAANDLIKILNKEGIYTPNDLKETQVDQLVAIGVKKFLALKIYDQLPIQEQPQQISTQPKTTQKSKSFIPQPSKSSSLKKVDTSSPPKQYFTLFHSLEDSSAEYKMSKVSFNQDQFNLLIESLQRQQNQIIGFYGNTSKCLPYIEEYLEQKLTIYDDFKEDQEALYAFKDGNKIALLFQTSNDIYEYKNKADSSQLTVTYIRFLIDLCENIFIAPKDNHQFNPDDKNPFVDFCNPGFKMQEQIIQPSDNVVVQEIMLVDQKNIDKEISNFQSQPDFSKFITTSKIDYKINSEYIKHEVNFYDLQKQQGYGHSKVYTKKMDYDQIKEEINKKWPYDQFYFKEEMFPRKFQAKALQIFSCFVKESKQEFENIVENLQNYFIEESTKLIEKQCEQYQEKSDIFHNNAIISLNELTCEYMKQQYKSLTEGVENYQKAAEEEKKGFWAGFRGFFQADPQQDEIKNKINKLKCESQCLNNMTSMTLQIRYASRCNLVKFDYIRNNWGSNNFIFHKYTFDQAFSILDKLNKELEQLKKQQINDRKDKLTELREIVVQRLFLSLDKLVETHQSSKQYSINVTFQSISFIRDASHKLLNWNINKIPTQISYQFPKDISNDFTLKSLFFVDETQGLVLFSNNPENKSSIYYFSFQSKGQVIFSHQMNLSSSSAHLVIEPNLKLWSIYDNKEKRFNMGKLTTNGKIEEGQPLTIYNEIRDGHRIEHIISVCFLPMTNSLYFIDSNYTLFEYKYMARILNVILKKENTGLDGIVKTKILPSIDGEFYFQIQAASDGKNMLLRSQTCLDIYAINLQKLYTFPINDKFQFCKTFTDNVNHFVVISSTDKLQCFQLTGLTATKQVSAQITGKQTSRSNGNPILDYFYMAFKKFGPHSSFLKCPRKTKLLFVLEYALPSNQLQSILKYFDGLQVKNTQLKIVNSKEVNKYLIAKDNSFIDSRCLKMILVGRVPLHVATIENYSLVPLQNGINISDLIAESIVIKDDKNTDLIERLINLIKVGAYESLLQNLPQDIKVISIVGRQSSGKSYVMNRFFGTRFNVAATRCTDGIWMSVVEMYDNNDTPIVYVVMDCEGLFSARRNEQEEMKLCLVLSALSDIMILNQDLAFNRHLNFLFNNFTKCIGRIKGKNLFKGCLLMLIRDVKSEEADGAYLELQSNQAQIQQSKSDSFLSAVFSGKLLSQCLNYFQQPIFNDEIDMVRNEYFLSLSEQRWKTGADYLQSLKIVLAQVYTDDDTDMDVHKLRITCEHQFQETIKAFYEGGGNFQLDDKYEQQLIIGDQTFTVTIPQKIIKLQLHQQETEQSAETSQLIVELITQFNEQTCEYTQDKHNNFITELKLCVQKFLEQRVSLLLQSFENNLPKDQEFVDIIRSYTYKLKNIFEAYSQLVQYCAKECRQCLRLCTMSYNHIDNCNCGTSHFCEIICDKTEDCINNQYLCIEKYGHEGSHRCNEGNHKCSSHCAVETCAYICSYELNHVEDLHNCGNKHPCNETCLDDYCTRTCQYDISYDHISHTCGETKCIHKCQFCDKQCDFENHFHQKLISEGDENELDHYLDDGSSIKMKYHVCNNEHPCQQLCEEKGVCRIDFKVSEKKWINEFGGEFEFKYFEPLEARVLCNKMIPKYQGKHEGIHKCSLLDTHRCFYQCPECKSFCNKKVDHDGLHNTNTHRNKEHSKFVTNSAKDKVEIKSEGRTRAYKIGESCQPEVCTQSCQRKGRAHYHLKECPGSEGCPAKINPYVKHSTDKFHPYEDKIFDLWLCNNYWESLEWEVPVDETDKEINSMCNFVCCHSSHGEDLSYCIKQAWHSEEHKFDCDHGSSYVSDVIDIVFCCDTTGSMSSYIEKSKSTCKQVISQVNLISSGKNVKFGFVAYRDHPPQDSTYITNLNAEGLCDETKIIAFINTLSAAGGGDGPEAVLDGLYDSINKMAWRKDSTRYIFHIADAPPHGKEYVTSGDGFPGGCPCGIKIETLALQLKENKIRYKLLKIGSYPQMMAEVFKKHIENFEMQDLDSAVQLDVKVSGIITRDIKCDEHDVLVFDS